MPVLKRWILYSGTLSTADKRRIQAGVFATVLVAAATVPLLITPGLYELGDANYPLHGLPVGVFRAWDDSANLGFDNIFVGLPRQLYFALVQLVSQAPGGRAGQFVLFLAIFMFAFAGAWRLSRRIGASTVAAPFVGALYVLNPWVESRISQTALIFAFSAFPWVISSLVDFVEARSARARLLSAMATGLLAPVLLCSLQMSYVCALAAGLTFVALLTLRCITARSLVLLATAGVSAAVASAYFLLPAILSAASPTHGGALANVAARFSFDSYRNLGSNETLWNALRFRGYKFSYWANAPVTVQIALLVFPALFVLGVIAFLRERGSMQASRRAIAFAALLFTAFALFMTAGVTLGASPAVELTWRRVPFMHNFVDPDYFAALAVLGFVVIVSQVRMTFITAVLALSAVFMTLPFVAPGGLFAKAQVPLYYSRLDQSSRADGRQLWLPRRWASRFNWSPYEISAWPQLVGTNPTYGPTTLEITPQHTYDFVGAEEDALASTRSVDFLWFFKRALTRNVVVMRDIIDDPSAPYTAADVDRLRATSVTLQELSSPQHRYFDARHYEGLSEYGYRGELPQKLSAPPQPLVEFTAVPAHSLPLISKELRKDVATPGEPAAGGGSGVILSGDMPDASLQPGRWSVLKIGAGSASLRLENRKITSVSSLHLPHASRVSLQPAAVRKMPFNDSWKFGTCSTATSHSKTRAMLWHVTSAVLQASSSDVVLCATHAIVLSQGFNLVTVRGHSKGNVSPRALILYQDNGQLVYSELSAAPDGTLQDVLDLSHTVSNAILFLYVDPARSGSVSYQAPIHEIFGTAVFALLHDSAESMPAVVRSIRPLNDGGFTATIAPCSRSCTVAGWWSYSGLWRANIDGLNPRHLVLDGYANAWVLPASRNERRLTVEFSPEKWHIAGVVVGALFVLLLGTFYAITLGLRLAPNRP